MESLPDSNKAETEGLVGLPTPIIAFEESMTQQNNTAGNEQVTSDNVSNTDPSYPSEILCRGEKLIRILMVTEAHTWGHLVLFLSLSNQTYFFQISCLDVSIEWLVSIQS